MRVSPEMKNKVQAKVDWVMEKAAKDFPQLDLPHPKVKYAKRGTVAGTAELREWTINLNPVLLMENGDVFIERTVVHELMHLLDYKLYPENFEWRPGQKRSVHGPTWKRLMMMFGADPSRCHTYDVSNAKVKKSAGYKYRYTCKTCGTHMDLGAKRHTKMKTGAARYWMRGCGRHAGYLFTHVVHPNGSVIEQHGINLPKGLPLPAPVVLPKAADAKKPASHKRPKNSQGSGTSKKEKALVIVRDLFGKGHSRKMTILRMMDVLGMTKAGASTYFYTAKKELGL